MAQQLPPLIIHKRRAPLRDATPHLPPFLQLRLEHRSRLLLRRRDAMHVVIGLNRCLPLLPFATRDEMHGWDVQDVGAVAFGAGARCHGAVLRVAEVGV